MSVINLFKVDFDVVKANTGGGNAWKYRRGARSVIVSAASAHSKDILAVLTSDITLGSGESFDVLQVQPIAAQGTEGNTIYS